VSECLHCGAPLDGRRADARYCSNAHRQRAFRRRRRFQPADAYRGTSALRGPTPMGVTTWAEEERLVGYDVFSLRARTRRAEQRAELLTLRRRVV
jgi:hypothetical protein